MGKTRPLEACSSATEITRRVKEGHTRILALFQQYLATPPEVREALVEQIIQVLASQLEMEENLLFEKLRKSGSEGRRRTGAIELEYEEVRTMLLELEHAEGDDDQALDEFFEDMMQSVRALFISEERDLFPLIDRSLDA